MEEMNELTAEERARILQHELEAVYGSSSYKIGRAVTWLPRHAKKALAYFLLLLFWLLPGYIHHMATLPLH